MQFLINFYFYLGGENFNNEADFTIFKAQSDTTTFRLSGMINIGDFNGDSYDDLMDVWEYHYTQPFHKAIQIYYCGPDFDLEPDWSYKIPRENVYTVKVCELGDINGDGNSDIGYISETIIELYEYHVNEMHIIYGNDSEPQIEFFSSVGVGQDSTGWHPSGIYPIGNINGDPFDDFMVKYYDPDIGHIKNYLFFGSNPIDSIADFSIDVQDDSPGGFNCGDYNNDGLDDFIGEVADRKFWYGNEQSLNEEPDLYLSETGMPDGHAFGDLNNDGYSDIIMGDKTYSLWDGKVYIFMGNNVDSEEYDFSIYTHNAELNWSWGEFGKSLAVGDFNNDGFDDLAVGAPDPDGHLTYGNPNYGGYGRVFVFAGNADLADIVNTENEEIPVANFIEFNAYPNPFNPIVRFDVKIRDNIQRNILIEIFNSKGQKVETLNVPEYITSSKTIMWNAEKNPSGIYLCKLINGKDQSLLSVKKVTLMK